MSISTVSQTQKSLLSQIKKIAENHGKYVFLVPIASFCIGGLVALIQYFLTKTPKYSIQQPCTICYTHNRSVLTQPCKHLVMCGNCAYMVRVCPFCRVAIDERKPIAQFINE